MWKDILVFADGSEVGLARLKLALAQSRRFGAHLEAQTFAAIPAPPQGPVTAALEAVYLRIVADVRADNAKALSAIKAQAPLGERFSAHAGEALMSRVDEAAAATARMHDLVIFGQPGPGAESMLDQRILTGALFAGPPCLMLPRWTAANAWGKRALIAWKATPQSVRALQAALPLLKWADSVRVLIVDPRQERGEDDAVLARLSGFLVRHGVNVETAMAIRSDYGDRVGQAILNEAEGFGADLLVMGAYGHARMAEFVFGGVTRHVIENARQPVLMSH